MDGNMKQSADVFCTNNKISNILLFCYDIERKTAYTKEILRPFKPFIPTVETIL
jgi:hypothetical protein